MRIKGVVFWTLLSPACWTLCTLNTSFYWHIFLTGTPPQCLLQSLLVVSRPERGGREQRDMPARELIPMTTETREAGGSGRLFCHVLMKAEWSRLDLHPSVAEQADSPKTLGDLHTCWVLVQGREMAQYAQLSSNCSLWGQFHSQSRDTKGPGTGLAVFYDSFPFIPNTQCPSQPEGLCGLYSGSNYLI